MISPVLSAAEMRAAEKAAFARGITAEELMDEAAAGIARTVSKFFPQPGSCVVFAGKGNNAGDAFAAAAILRARGWKIELRLAFPEAELGELASKKRATLETSNTEHRTSNIERGELRCSVFDVGCSMFSSSGAATTVVLDGLLGLGAKPPLRGPIRSACREINRLRRKEGVFVFAIDIPTGLEADSGKADRDCVSADCTITIGFAKRGLVADRALGYVGRIEVIELGCSVRCLSAQTQDVATSPVSAEDSGRYSLLTTAESLRGLLPRRHFNAYKNQFGRVGVLAGSKGLTGAAILCATGALRGGAGLVEVFVPADIYSIVASAAPPEAMVKVMEAPDALLKEKIDVWAIGPGLGTDREEVLPLIERAKQPMVIDADALNILAAKKKGRPGERPSLAAGPRLLTPHPGEMKRLFPAGKATRAKIATRFCHKFPVTLLLKGSRTVVAERGQPLSYNTTGNPGMATGGMGDILTGVCAALIAQKLAPYDAARLGAWVCGRAAEIAISHGGASEQSLLPTDVLAHLGAAFRELRIVQ